LQSFRVAAYFFDVGGECKPGPMPGPENQTNSMRRRHFLAGGSALAISACVRVPRAPYTAAEASAAGLPGYGFVRIAVDAPLAAFDGPGRRFLPAHAGRRPDWLALSGGGTGGAYGAAFLLGWAERGDRPMFDLVTGVSAGALIAPYAFLGKAGDAVLGQIFQPADLSGLAGKGNPLRAVLGTGLFGPDALYRMVARFADEALMDQVAARHRAGARLLVQTTDLDSERGYVWDLGAIAASAQAGRLELFRRVLTASSSAPAIFSPQPIEVSAGGRRFAELHADGGLTSEVLTIPDRVLRSDAPLYRSLRPRLYVIFNESLENEFRLVSDNGIAVSGRAASVMIRNTARQDLSNTLDYARERGLTIRVTSIDQDLGYDAQHPFAAGYALAARKLGRERGLAGSWNPPDWVP